MRGLVLTLAVMAGGSALAQQTTFKIIPAGSGCPVGFSAEVSARALMHSAGDEEKYGSAPALELRFVPSPFTKVVKASVTVHGLPVGSRVIPVSGQDARMSSEQFELRAKQFELRDQEVRVTKLAVVKWAEVTEMTFADGTSWHPAQGAMCRAVPSPFREVGAVAAR